MLKKLSSRGQNVIEYLLLTSTVLVVLIGGVLLKHGVFVEGTGKVLNLPAGELIQLKNSMSFVDGNGSAVTGMIANHAD